MKIYTSGLCTQVIVIYEPRTGIQMQIATHGQLQLAVVTVKGSSKLFCSQMFACALDTHDLVRSM